MVVVTACTGTTSGSPSPSPTAGRSSSAGVTPSEGQLPPRPREIILDGVDPCALWTSAQLAQLAVGPAPKKGTSTAGDEMCSFDAASIQPPKASFSALLVLDHDVMDDFLPEDGDTVIDVDGFPAILQTAPATGPQPCAVLVSTADGQYLEIRLTYGSTEAHLSGEQACDLTSKAATFAMQTLQTQR